ncbi:MAG: hypothetical protein PHE89_02415 [Alphaproteobacteria bacterium]|nr:hypothetical protein [Alphaproteobacteria bacterium]
MKNLIKIVTIAFFAVVMSAVTGCSTKKVAIPDYQKAILEVSQEEALENFNLSYNKQTPLYELVKPGKETEIILNGEKFFHVKDIILKRENDEKTFTCWGSGHSKTGNGSGLGLLTGKSSQKFYVVIKKDSQGNYRAMDAFPKIFE